MAHHQPSSAQQNQQRGEAGPLAVKNTVNNATIPCPRKAVAVPGRAPLFGMKKCWVDVTDTAAVAGRAQAFEAACNFLSAHLQKAALRFVGTHTLVVSVVLSQQPAQNFTQNFALFDEPIPLATWRDLRDTKLTHP